MVTHTHHVSSNKGDVNKVARKNEILNRFLTVGLIYALKVVLVVWWQLLEWVPRDPSQYHIIHSKLDDIIPFNELFIIPYASWFFYINVSSHILAIVFGEIQEVFRFEVFTVIGELVFLLTSTFWPNGLDIRPKVMPRDNALVRLVWSFYRVDPPINVTPTIHVYSTIAAMIAGTHMKKVPKLPRYIYVYWGVLICVSVVFVKQHSVVDVAGALIMAVVVYPICYRTDFPLRFYRKFINRKILKFH